MPGDLQSEPRPGPTEETLDSVTVSSATISNRLLLFLRRLIIHLTIYFYSFYVRIVYCIYILFSMKKSEEFLKHYILALMLSGMLSYVDTEKRFVQLQKGRKVSEALCL